MIVDDFAHRHLHGDERHLRDRRGVTYGDVVGLQFGKIVRAVHACGHDSAASTHQTEENFLHAKEIENLDNLGMEKRRKIRLFPLLTK